MQNSIFDKFNKHLNKENTYVPVTRINSVDDYRQPDGINSTDACIKTIDIIFDKIIELMNKDVKKSKFEKAIVINGAKGLKEPVKNYIFNMSEVDTEDIVRKIEAVVKTVNKNKSIQ